MDLAAIMDSHPGDNAPRPRLPPISELSGSGSNGAVSDLPLKNIAVYGSLNMDIFNLVAHAPLGGETVLALDSYTAPGGKGANQATACAKLARVAKGSPLSETWDRPPLVATRLYGAVGNDAFGRSLTIALEGFGVDCSAVAIVEEAATGMALIIIESTNAENRIIVSANANFMLKPERFPDLPDPTPDVILLQLEITTEVVFHIMRLAKGKGVPVILNASPVKDCLPPEVYQGLDHLIVNETECRTLLSHANPHRPLSANDAEQAAAAFSHKGVRNVVITLGAQGAFCRTISGPGRLVTSEYVPPEELVDTTGAGDTFAGAYAMGFVLNKDNFNIVAAVVDGCQAAAQAVKKRGAIPSIPFRSDLSQPQMRFDHARRNAAGEFIISNMPSELAGDEEPGQKRVSDDGTDSPDAKRQRGRDEPME
jgi:ribokinase